MAGLSEGPVTVNRPLILREAATTFARSLAVGGDPWLMKMSIALAVAVTLVHLAHSVILIFTLPADSEFGFTSVNVRLPTVILANSVFDSPPSVSGGS